MVQISNIAEARKVLAQFVPRTWSSSQPYTLDRMHSLMTLLGNPERNLKVIHVAGTSGKTSTSYYIAALLQQSRKKVGLTVSPHVDEVNERVQIDLEPLPEVKFCSQLSKFLEIIDKLDIQPTYFELLVAFAFWQFKEEGVDYAVVEVGLGGLLDGTNITDEPDKVCVITDIGLDHTNVLGKDVKSIAAQKAGIIKDHNAVFCFDQGGGVTTAIKDACAAHHGQLRMVRPKPASHTAQDLPLFQQRNFQLANEVADYIVERDGLTPLSEIQLAKSRDTYIPARMEVVKIGGKTVIMDGAHNPQKIGAAVHSLQHKFPDQKMQVVLGLLGDKELDSVISELKPIASKLYATYFSAEQDMPRQAIDPNEIVKTARAYWLEAVAINKPERAFQAALDGADLVLVIGSFFLLNHIRPLIFKS